MNRFFALLLTAVTMTANAQPANVAVEQGAYEPNWQSVAQWECPEWFKDAKFGIWAHWGPQCQAEDGDWYARFMYYEGSGQYNWHVNHFGNPNDYGLKELIRDWTADEWNPEELVALYKSVGARYFMTLGNHHDNFDLWDSPYQEWNSVNMGPKRDIVKGWSDACKKNGLPLGVSMHASHAWTWLEPSQSFDGNLTKADGTGKWWEGYDPHELYAQNHDHSTGWESSGTIHSQWDWGNGASLPSEAYKLKFQNRVLQCINDYQPDMIYFDDTVLPFYGCDETIGLNILAHYYNKSAKANNGQQQVVTMGKILSDSQKEAILWDVERGIPDRPQAKYWQTCTCIGDWHYNINRTSYKSAEQVVSMLIDIVSKNGNLLLSIPVRGNGTIDQNERNVLAGIKAWMDINSESIYGTRPWKSFGEGPLAEAANPMTAQGFNEGQAYSAQDVRYVQKVLTLTPERPTVYATIMRWPAAGQFTFKAFSIGEATYSGEVDKVTLLGGSEVAFTQDINGLNVTIPSTKPNAIAPVFRISFKEETRTAYELLQAIIAETEAAESEATASAHPYNTGKVNPGKLEALHTAITTAKSVAAGLSDEEYDAAREALASAYRTFASEGINAGGAFSSVIDENLTADYLVEAANFTRSAGGNNRFGKPQNWTVENFNIPNGSSGTKQGLDNYSGKEALMLGVWNDAGSNTTGDLSNARIYRKITLPKGKYYFGAAYNTTYNMSSQAYMFVSKALCNTAEIPEQSIAYYGINKCTGNLTLQGLYFQLDEETELYIGFQANLLNGSATQEFRAENVALYTPKASVEMHSERNGWQRLSTMPNDVSQYFFAFYEQSTNKGLVLAAGSNQGTGNKAMWFQDYVFPETNKNALWTFDGFDSSNYSGAKGDGAKWIVITGVGDTDNCLHSNPDRPWNYRTENNGEGWTDRGYLTAAYLPDGYWTLTNKIGGQNIGHWDDTDEVAGNATGTRIGQFDIYAILRGQYSAVVENLDKASESNPVDISYLITNADGARYNNFHAKQPVGWTLSQDDAFECEYANYLPAKIGSSYFNKWQGSGNLTNRSISQQLTGLPSGTYRIAVRTSASTIHQGAWLFANSDKADMTQLTDNTVRLTTNVTDGMLTLGVKLENYTSNDCKFDHFTLEYLGNTMATMSIGEAHYGTFAAPFEVTLPAGVTAYTVDGVTGNTLTLTELTTVIPTNTPVVTYCENSVDESFTGMPISGSPRHGWLHGVYHQTVVPADAYVLQNLDGKTGFYRVAEGLQPTLKANRCYLSESEPSAVRAYFFDKDNATGIQTLNALLNAGARIYGTDGQQRNRLEKGVNIVNNKKIFIK
jgi:alpha-L-fucosidase